MANLVYMALVFYVILVGPTAAQTTGTTSRGGGTNLANPYGAVSLPTTTATQTSSATTTGTAVTTGGSPIGSSSGTRSASGTQSSTSGTVGSTSSARTTAGGSSATGTAAVSNVPAWVLCPPAGATGLEPFVAGTRLSCAP
jgi:hypothetical protein